MAVEKSYARLGLFLVVVLVVVLATALLFIQRLRSRAVIAVVTYTTENVSGLEVSSPVRYRGVSVGRVTDVRVDPRGEHRSRSTSRCSSIASTRLARTSSGSGETADVEGMFPKLRAQVVSNPVTGEAYLLLDVPENPPPPIALGFTPDRRVCPVDAHAAGDGAGSTAGGPGARRSDAADPQGDRRQDSRQPRPERSILHQRRAHLSGERAPGAERRLAEVLRDDTSGADRARSTSRRCERADRSSAGDAGHVRRRGARRDQGGRPSGHEPVRARRGGPDRRSRPTICGARCRPFAIRSISCAISRGNSRSSRSRSSMVRGRRR